MAARRPAIGAVWEVRLFALGREGALRLVMAIILLALAAGLALIFGRIAPVERLDDAQHVGFAVTELADGVVVAVGTATGVTGSDAWAIAVDPGDRVVWQQRVGAGGEDWAADVVPFGDGVAMAGTTRALGGAEASFWLVMLGPDGAVRSEAEYRPGPSSRLAAVAPAPDGFVLAGTVAAADGRDAAVVRVDPGGAVVWQRVVERPGDDAVSATAGLADGGVGLVGTGTAEDGRAGFRVARLSPGGETVWDVVVPMSLASEALGAVWADDGTVTAVGTVGKRRRTDARVLRMDAAGEVIWDVRHGVEGWDGAVGARLVDGGALVAGRRGSRRRGRILVFEVSDAGAVAWERAVGDDRQHEVNGVGAAADGALLLVGLVASAAEGTELWLGRVARDGELTNQAAFGQ